MVHHRTLLSIFFSLIFFSTVIYLTGCSNTVTTSSGPVTSTYHARSEQDFVSNSSLKAEPGAVVFVKLEDANSPAESFDTGTIGVDIIPYSISAEERYSYRLGDSSFFKVKMVSDASGTSMFEISPASRTASVLLPAGNYKLHITSLIDYAPGTKGNQPVFIQQDKELSGGNLDSARLKSFFQTGQCYSCHLAGVNLSSLGLLNVVLDNSDLTGSNFSYSNLEGASLKNCEFAYSNLSYLHSAKDAFFTDSKFYGVNFTGANLFLGRFHNAFFRNAIFTNADLSATDCRGAYFCGAIKTGLISEGILTDAFTHCWP